MKNRLALLGIVAVLAVAVLSIVAVWTGDVRWGYTAAVVGGATFVITMAIGMKSGRWPA